MANYQGAARTNYFNVKDESAFRAWAAKFGLKVIESDGLLGLLPGDYADDGTFSVFDKEQDDSLDICDEIAAHLADDSVAVVMEAGHEKLCYISGWAVAINSAGERVQIVLDDIYEAAAKKLGVKPTRATN